MAIHHRKKDCAIMPFEGDPWVVRMQSGCDRAKTVELATNLFFFDEMTKNMGTSFCGALLEQMIALATDPSVDRNATMREKNAKPEEGIPVFQSAVSYAPLPVVEALVSVSDLDVNAAALHTNAVTVFAYNPFLRRRTHFYREKGCRKEHLWQKHTMGVFKALIGNPQTDVGFQMAFRAKDAKGQGNFGDFLTILDSRDAYLADYARRLVGMREQFVLEAHAGKILKVISEISETVCSLRVNKTVKNHVVNAFHEVHDDVMAWRSLSRKRPLDKGIDLEAYRALFTPEAVCKNEADRVMRKHLRMWGDEILSAHTMAARPRTVVSNAVHAVVDRLAQ